jgi:hypothetical protein
MLLGAIGMTSAGEPPDRPAEKLTDRLKRLEAAVVPAEAQRVVGQMVTDALRGRRPKQSPTPKETTKLRAIAPLGRRKVRAPSAHTTSLPS